MLTRLADALSRRTGKARTVDCHGRLCGRFRVDGSPSIPAGGLVVRLGFRALDSNLGFGACEGMADLAETRLAVLAPLPSWLHLTKRAVGMRTYCRPQAA